MSFVSNKSAVSTNMERNDFDCELNKEEKIQIDGDENQSQNFHDSPSKTSICFVFKIS